MRWLLGGLCDFYLWAFEFQGVSIIAFVLALNLSCLPTKKNFGSPWHVQVHISVQVWTVRLRISTPNIAAW